MLDKKELQSSLKGVKKERGEEERLGIVKEHHAQLYNVFTGALTEDDNRVFANRLYGDDYCHQGKSCIKDLTQEAIYNMCQACTGTKTCSFDIQWRVY